METSVLTRFSHHLMQILMIWFRSHLNSFWMRGSQSSKANHSCSWLVSTMQPWVKHTLRPGSIICMCSSQLLATNLVRSPSMLATSPWMDSAYGNRTWSLSSSSLSLYLSINRLPLNRITILLQINLKITIKLGGQPMVHSKTIQRQTKV